MSLVDWAWRLGCSAMLFVPVIGCEHKDEITSRAYVSLLVADTLPQRKQIALDLLSGKLISTAGILSPMASAEGALVMQIDFGWVTAGGAVLLNSKKYGVSVVQEPTVVNGRVRWSCVVHPVEFRPNVCGDT